MFSIYKISKVVILGAFLLSGTCVQAMEKEEPGIGAKAHTGKALKGTNDASPFDEFLQFFNGISSWFDGGAKEQEVKPVSNLTEALVLEVLILPWFDEPLNRSKELRETFNLVSWKLKNHISDHINGPRTIFKVDDYGIPTRMPCPPKFLRQFHNPKYTPETPLIFFNWLARNVEVNNLRHVYLSSTYITDDTLTRLHNLTSLGMHYEGIITNGGLKTLTNLKNLSLATGGRDSCHTINISDEGVKDLTGLETLELTDIHSITDGGLERLTNLRNLSVESMWITGKGLNGFKNLTDLRLKQAFSFADNELKNLTNLQNLHLNFMKEITDTGLQSLTNLTHLSLQACNKITDTGLESLTDLTYLSLDFMKAMTGTGLKNLTKLTSLHLVQMPVSDNELKNLPNLTDLHLNLSDDITDEGLRSLPTLTDLYLRGSTITDEGLKSLTNLTNLSFGRRKECVVTGSSFKFLPVLQTINLFNDSGVCAHKFHTESDKRFSEDQINSIIKLMNQRDEL